MCYVWQRFDNPLKNVSSCRFLCVYRHCFAFLFVSINRFLKQNFSLDQQSFVVTFVAQQLAYFGVLASYGVVENLTSSNFEDLKIVGDL